VDSGLLNPDIDFTQKLKIERKGYRGYLYPEELI